MPGHKSLRAGKNLRTPITFRPRAVDTCTLYGRGQPGEPYCNYTDQFHFADYQTFPAGVRSGAVSGETENPLSKWTLKVTEHC